MVLDLVRRLFNLEKCYAGDLGMDPHQLRMSLQSSVTVI